MKHLLILVALFVSFNAQAYVFEQTGCTDKDVAAAEAEVRQANGEFREGGVTMADVLAAELVVKETVFCKEAPDQFSVSCEDMVGLQHQVVDQFRKEHTVGVRTNSQYGEQVKKLGALLLNCK